MFLCVISIIRSKVVKKILENSKITNPLFIYYNEQAGLLQPVQQIMQWVVSAVD